jgi:hypothetical protein
MVREPLPMAEVWAEMKPQVEALTGQAGTADPESHPGK